MRDNDFCDSEVSESLSQLNDIFKEWCNCLIRLCDTSQTVPLQSKPEETNVGIFAGAAWRKDWIAFQEMSRRKKDLGGGDGYGYCDLWIRKEGTLEYYFECKGNKTRSSDDARYIFNEAIKDTERLNTEEPNAIKVAMAFCNLQFKNWSLEFQAIWTRAAAIAATA